MAGYDYRADGGDGVKARIFNIQKFCIHDGPGIRTTVFFAGCPLRCKWCHNPEGQSSKKEIMIRKATCKHCGLCDIKCNHEECKPYGKCLHICPNDLIPSHYEVIESENPNKDICFYINSPGGSVKDGLAVYDVIRLMKSPVTTICIGMAASMGSILFLAADKRLMLPHSEIMIHDASFGQAEFSGLKPDEIQQKTDDLLHFPSSICC